MNLMTNCVNILQRNFRRRILFNQLLIQTINRNNYHLRTITMKKQSSFVPKNVLIVSKVSRIEFERIHQSNLTEYDLKMNLIERGCDYDSMQSNHERNKSVENEVIDVLNKQNIQYKLTNRLTIDRRLIDWADLVMTIGGDGTFLLGANLIFDNKKPIIGINSDPELSEGYLLLPANYTKNIPNIFSLLQTGDYEYLMRSRIRVTLQGNGIWSEPFHMHEKSKISGGNMTNKSDDNDGDENKNKQNEERRLPWLALNEVFIGESWSARTSSLDICLDEKKDFSKVKCSGICISTGTGSSSWHKAINSLTTQMVQDILKVANPQREYTSPEIDNICTTFNNNLIFSPDDSRMSYSIRDIILNDIWPLPKTINPRDFCKRITIRSQCYDAGLVFDGGIAMPFNSGTVAILECHPEDALKTIKLPA